MQLLLLGLLLVTGLTTVSVGIGAAGPHVHAATDAIDGDASVPTAPGAGEHAMAPGCGGSHCAACTPLVTPPVQTGPGPVASYPRRHREIGPRRAPEPLFRPPIRVS